MNPDVNGRHIGTHSSSASATYPGKAKPAALCDESWYLTTVPRFITTHRHPAPPSSPKHPQTLHRASPGRIWPRSWGRTGPVSGWASGHQPPRREGEHTNAALSAARTTRDTAWRAQGGAGREGGWGGAAERQAQAKTPTPRLTPAMTSHRTHSHPQASPRQLLVPTDYGMRQQLVRRLQGARRDRKLPAPPAERRRRASTATPRHTANRAHSLCRTFSGRKRLEVAPAPAAVRMTWSRSFVASRRTRPYV